MFVNIMMLIFSKEALVAAHSCGRLTNWSHLSNLANFSYWFIQADRLLLKKDLNKISPEYIYKVMFLFLFLNMNKSNF